MVKKIENEGSTILISDSATLEELDAESMLGEEEKEENDYLSIHDDLRISPSFKLYVNFKEINNDKCFGGILNNYRTETTKIFFFTLKVHEQDIVDFPIGGETAIEKAELVFGERTTNVLKKNKFFFSVKNIDTNGDNTFTVLIKLTQF